ncbi:MAG: hypothetical protein IEMM0002_0563 [bacterium]|nr:MAG: hypothetical protein IEMM0002_0563 [bacterium]
MDKEETLRIIEAILFVSDGPVAVKDISSVLDGSTSEDVSSLLEEFGGRLGGHGVEVVEIAGGLQMRTRSECGKWIKKFHQLNRSTKLSQASLETLSIIAYKQPVTRQEIEDVRGVDSSGPVRTLLDKNLIKSMGRRKLPGKPMTFGTTQKFLEYFGLVKLSDLPTLKEFPAELEGTQKNLNFDQPNGTTEAEEETEEKFPEDIQIEEEAAAVEPVEEDYADEESEYEDIESGEEAVDRVSSDEGDSTP